MAAKKAKPATPTERTPAELVEAYANEGADLSRRGEGGPEQLPSGAVIMTLPADGRALAAVAAYRAIPRASDGAYGKRIMLGLLATTLLRAKLPFDDAQILAMVEGAAHGISPAYGPCDYDRALVAMIVKRGVRPNATLAAALARLVARRGDRFAEDRKIGALVAEALRLERAT